MHILFANEKIRNINTPKILAHGLAYILGQNLHPKNFAVAEIATFVALTMWLFDLFKKKNAAPAELSSHVSFEENLLKQSVDFIPSHFRNTQTYANVIEYLSHNQLALALKSLVKLGDQPNFYFNNDYWIELSQAATRLNLPEEYAICQRKLDDNKINNIVLYKGIVIEKVSDDTYKHYISDYLNNEKNEERRTKDGLAEIKAVNGFHMRSYGKEGTIYYIINKRVCEIKYQLSRVSGCITIYRYSYEYWVMPIRQRLSDAEKETLRKEITDWLKTELLTPEFE